MDNFTFEQSIIINETLKTGISKGSFILSILDIYEITEDKILMSILESITQKLDKLSDKEFKNLMRKLPLESYIVKEDLN